MSLSKAGFFAFPTAVVLSVLLSAGVLSAQTDNGFIYGRITDEEGILLSGARVTARAPQIAPVSAETDPRGLYRLMSLSPSPEYEIIAELAGYKTATRASVVLQARSSVEIDLILRRQDPPASEWIPAKEAFERLVREPSPITTRGFYLTISDERCPKGDKTAILDYILGPDRPLMPDIGRFSVIAAEMLNGDLQAVRSAVRILGFAQNEWSKPPGVKLPILMRIGDSLGTLMRVDPRLYLRACQEERESSFLREKGQPYGFIPFILHIRKTMVSYDMEMRKEAIRSVEDPELQVIRDECLYLIENGTQVMEAYGRERPVIEVPEAKGSGIAQETVRRVLLAMVARPDQETMKKVLALFDERRQELRYVTAALFPLISCPDQVWPPQKPFPEPLAIIIHEAVCGNKYAIEIAFTALRQAFRFWDDLASQTLVGFISDLILMKPATFIENAAKFGFLESEKLDTARITFLEWICGNVDFRDYPDERAARETILRRRIAVLETLDMPEQKELIRRCIGYIEKQLR